MTETAPRDYTNNAQQRIIKVILTLFGDPVNGFLSKDLAQAVGCSLPVMTGDTFNLEKAGIAERDEASGRWRLTPRLPQQAIKVWTAIDRAERRIAEARQRYTLPAGQSADDMTNRFKN